MAGNQNSFDKKSDRRNQKSDNGPPGGIRLDAGAKSETGCRLKMAGKEEKVMHVDDKSVCLRHNSFPHLQQERSVASGKVK
ncbi:MAG: hypothetical protein P8Y63_05410 [Deltaproteobacteria bacterium]